MRRTSPQPQPRQIVAMLVALSVVAALLLALPASALGWEAGTFSSSSESTLVRLTNQSRAAAGLRSLRVDSTLVSVARWRSKDMSVRNYFSHSIPPSGKMVFSVLQQKGYCFVVAGENIGWNTYPDDEATQVIQQMFMSSPGHRANILGKGWDVIGIGAYQGADGKKIWTVLFADKCGSTTTKPRATPRPTLRPTVKATPRPTPRATPVPSPEPSPVPVDPNGPPRPDATEPPRGPVPTLPPTPTPEPTTPPSTPSPTPEPGDTAHGGVSMRVGADPSRADLLTSTITDVLRLVFPGGG